MYAYADILEAPGNITVGLGQATFNLTCRIRRENVGIEIDRLLVGFDEIDLDGRGITVYPQTSVGSGNDTVTTQLFSLEFIEINNNTIVACLGTDEGFTNDIASPDAFITILGIVAFTVPLL